MREQRLNMRSTTAKAATSTTFEGARPTRAFSTSTMAAIEARTLSKDFRPSPHGREDLPGPCADMPRSSSSWQQYRKANSNRSGDAGPIEAFMRKAAEATCDFYIEHSPTDGIPYWDTGAPELYRLGNWAAKPADPFNPYEPVDSSAAAIGAQGLLRLGRYLGNERYWNAGLAVCNTLFDEPYLSTDPEHQGLLLHTVYHRPNGWDAAPGDGRVPRGEACMWGDYHLREVALYLLRIVEKGTYLTFWSQGK